MSSYPPVVRSTSTLAVVSLVFGIVTWLVLPLVGALVAVVCGHLARAEIRRAPEPGLEGDGMALAGLILGYVHLAVVVLLVLLFWGVLFLSLGAAWHWH
jgi:hypothetical protein